MRELRLKYSRSVRWGIALVGLIAGFALWPLTELQAQRGGSETPVNVTGVTTHTKGSDAVVSISGDSALSRAQTWQDDEGFHVVVYKGQSTVKGLPRGVKARRVGDSLELVVPVKAGGSVYVQPRFNQLDLVVGGGLQTGVETNEHARPAVRGGTTLPTIERNQQPTRRERVAGEQTNGAAVMRESSKRKQTEAQESRATQPQHNPAPPNARSDAQHAQNMLPATYQSGAVLTQNGQLAASQPASAAQPPVNVQPATPPVAQPAQPLPVTDATGAAQTSALNMPLLVLGLCFTGGLVAFLFIYRRRRKTDDDWEDAAEEETSTALTKATPMALNKSDAQSAELVQGVQRLEPNAQGERRKTERRDNLGRRANDKAKGVAPAVLTEPQSGAQQERKTLSFTNAQPAVVFGAYRIDQEVEKLLQGQAHSIEVLAARAADDRRAVETSLLKALHANMLGTDEQRRARVALEEYGFVARQSATLLLAADAYERTSAARALGQIGSPSSLPFLLEALHDPEPVVCTEVVTSLGALGLPSAIGALLDLARRHPELPTPLLGRALSACSVDCIDIQAEGASNGRLLADGSFTGDIDGLEPVGHIEQLPEWLDDHTLADALARLGSTDVAVRTAAAQQLAQFQVRRSVDALNTLAAIDEDATVRATAVTSLGIIGHESVFAAVLIGMADEAREVRAAAARALSRLSFDRADAYVRVIESSDEETMQRVARACVTAGLATQALNRLASEDRRQAYEAFSLLTLVVKGGEGEIIFAAVEHVGELNVRLAAARLLALQGQAETVKRLRSVALGNGTPEKLRNAILEAIYRDDHAVVE